MEPTAADVMPKVIIQESLKATGGTAKEQAARAVGQKLVDKSTPEEWRRAQEAMNRKKPVEQRNTDRKLDEIGVERDAGTGKKKLSTDEQLKYDKAKKAVDLAKKVVDFGFDKTKLNATEQATLTKAIENRLMSDPLLSQEFNSLTATQKTTEIERRLQDPKFMADLSEELGIYLDPEKKLLDVEGSRLDKERAEDDLADAKAERASIDRRIALTAGKLKAFESIIPPGGVTSIKGEKLLKIELTEVNIQKAQAELAKVTQSLVLQEVKTKELREELDRLQKQRTSGILVPSGPRNERAVQDDLTIAQTQERVVKEEVAKAEQELSNFEKSRNDLREEQDVLIEQQRVNDMEIRKLDRKVQEADREYQRRLWKFTDEVKVRTGQEEDLASNLNNVFSRTADKYIRDEIQEVEGKVNAELEEMKKKTTDVNEQAMIEALQRRWEGRERGFGKNKYRAIDKDKVQADFITLRDIGPESLMEEMLSKKLEARENPATGVNYTHTDAVTEAKRLLADKSDTGLYKKMEPEVALQLLRRKLMTGGVRREDVFNIENAPWGEGVAVKAMGKNTELKKHMEQLVGESAINPGFSRKLWEETKKRPWLLALLVGLVALPVMAAKEGTSPIIK